MSLSQLILKVCGSSTTSYKILRLLCSLSFLYTSRYGVAFPDYEPANVDTDFLTSTIDQAHLDYLLCYESRRFFKCHGSFRRRYVWRSYPSPFGHMKVESRSRINPSTIETIT